MIRVIGSEFFSWSSVARCTECSTLIEYCAEDVIEVESSASTTRYYVDCPKCSVPIDLVAVECYVQAGRPTHH